MKNVEILAKMDIFAQVSSGDLEKIAGLLKEKKMARDAIVFRQGDAGDALYVVQSGRLKCTTADAGGMEKVLGFYTEGQFLGEMALLTGEPRSATVQCVADSMVLMLRKEDFDGFLARNVGVMLQMMKVIAQRQAATSLRLTRELQGAEVAPPTGKVFTVFSPKGGVGKSTVAVNLAVALARAHPEAVALVDLSLTFGHDTLLLNQVPKSSLSATSADALRKMEMADGLAYYLAVHPSSTLRIMPGSLRPEEGETVTGEAAKVAIEQLQRHFDYVVVDTGSYFTDPVISALESADRILMLCSPEISTLRDVRECQRILNDVVHIHRDRIRYIMNYIFPFKTLTREQFESALQQELYLELPYSSDAPAKAALKGESLVETQPGSPMSKALLKLAALLAAEGEKSGVAAGAGQDRKRGFFR